MSRRTTHSNHIYGFSDATQDPHVPPVCRKFCKAKRTYNSKMEPIIIIYAQRDVLLKALTSEVRKVYQCRELYKDGRIYSSVPQPAHSFMCGMGETK